MPEDTVNKNVQKFVILVHDHGLRAWVVGTDSQRGFTARGAQVAVSKLTLPKGWTATIQELTPISDILAINR